ncbi:MAG: 50S ribosomal protein L20 [Lentisphaerae bacterium]|jgi:large subunit ribosomal protein L20|nr:50S ribosomal protein L20 [Lentisphaerota bacterium]
MSRITNAPTRRQRRRRRLAQAKGFYGNRSRTFRQATEAVDRAMSLSYAHRKKKKGDFRGLWIVRLSAACRSHEISYSRFIEGLTKAGVELNRKMLSEIAIHDAEGFAALVALARSKATDPKAAAK